MNHHIHFIRHGNVLHNGEHRYIGSTNLSLTQDGLAEVLALKESVPDIKGKQLYCSPMARTKETCELLFPETHFDIKSGLREIDFGDWENLTFEEIADRYPEETQKWTDNEAAFCFPNGEGILAFRNRVCDSLNALIKDMTEDIIIVTHGGVIRTGICHLTGLPLSNYLLFSVHTASLTTVEVFDAHGILKQLNWKPKR